MFLQTVGCVHMSLTTLGKAAQSICVPHISHVTVDETLAGRGVSPLYTFKLSHQGTAANWLKDPSKAIVDSMS